MPKINNYRVLELRKRKIITGDIKCNKCNNKHRIVNKNKVTKIHSNKINTCKSCNLIKFFAPKLI